MIHVDTFCRKTGFAQSVYVYEKSHCLIITTASTADCKSSQELCSGHQCDSALWDELLIYILFVLNRSIK